MPVSIISFECYTKIYEANNMLYANFDMASACSLSRKYFALYADACFAHFGDRVKNWITINEPLQTSVNGYDTGIFAPGRREGSSNAPYLVAHHQILAHAAAVSVYRNKYKVQLCRERFRQPLNIHHHK